MNKNVKRIVAMALVLGAVSGVAPATNINFLNTKAYAASDENDDETLDSLELKTSSGSTIKFYDDDDYKDRVDEDDIDDDETYYAKTSSKTISMSIKGPSSKYVKVFKGTSKSTKGKSITSDIDLSSGTNTLVVRVYSSRPSSDVEYEDNDDVTSEYTFKIKYTGTTSTSDNADNYDDIYLKNLLVDGTSVSLSKSKISYSYNVATDVDKVTIKAEPEDEDYTVTIGSDEVDESDKYKTTVALNKGENKIKIKIENEDDDEERIYTLTINRGSTTSTSTGNTTTNAPAVKANQWVQANGIWQYNDAVGSPLKNTWFYDKNTGKNFYLKEDGSMTTNWFNYNGAWYYFGTDGAMTTGWQLSGGVWYYLNSEGRMQTGWIKDAGKYYYLNSNGAMAYNTTIGGYKLGADGAWIAR